MHTAEGKPHVAHTSNLIAFAAVAPGRAARGQRRPPVRRRPHGARRHGRRRAGGDDRQAGVPLPGRAAQGAAAHPRRLGPRRQNEHNPLHIADTPVWGRAALPARRGCRWRPPARRWAWRPARPATPRRGTSTSAPGAWSCRTTCGLDNAMKDGSFAANPVFLKAIDTAKAHGGALHLLALLTKKSSHGSIDYPLALLDMARARGMEGRVRPHHLDGRSTEPGSAPALLRELGAAMEQKGVGCIVSGVGRGIALDRDQNWGKVAARLRVHRQRQGRPLPRVAPPCGHPQDRAGPFLEAQTFAPQEPADHHNVLPSAGAPPAGVNKKTRKRGKKRHGTENERRNASRDLGAQAWLQAWRKGHRPRADPIWAARSGKTVHHHRRIRHPGAGPGPGAHQGESLRHLPAATCTWRRPRRTATSSTPA